MKKKLKSSIINQKSSMDYVGLLTEIKDRVRRAQVKATLSVNAEMILMYWDVGRMIQKRQQHEGWGSKVIPQLSRDIRNELPEIKGFSERNIGRMIAFYREYSDLEVILPQVVAKTSETPEPVAAKDLMSQIPWGHHMLLMEKIKDFTTRIWYMAETMVHSGAPNRLHNTGLHQLHNGLRAGRHAGSFWMSISKCLPNGSSLEKLSGGDSLQQLSFFLEVDL